MRELTSCLCPYIYVWTLTLVIIPNHCTTTQSYQRCFVITRSRMCLLSQVRQFFIPTQTKLFLGWGGGVGITLSVCMSVYMSCKHNFYSTDESFVIYLIVLVHAVFDHFVPGCGQSKHGDIDSSYAFILLLHWPQDYKVPDRQWIIT